MKKEGEKKKEKKTTPFSLFNKNKINASVTVK
jgi:hypothetical protein